MSRPALPSTSVIRVLAMVIPRRPVFMTKLFSSMGSPMRDHFASTAALHIDPHFRFVSAVSAGSNTFDPAFRFLLAFPSFGFFFFGWKSQKEPESRIKGVG